MTDVVFVQPKVGDWDEARSHPSLPLAILNTASLVENEYKVKIIDQRLNKDWKKELKHELNKNPICVGITSMTGKQISYALEVSKFIKQESNIPVIWGGVHGNILPIQTLENQNIDILVCGEGDVTFYELVKNLDKKKN